MRKISNSEVNTWLQCRRKYWYGYVMDLEPKVLSGPLTKGNMIHSFLEEYYLTKMDGGSHEEALNSVNMLANRMAADPSIDMLELMKTRDLCLAYFEYWAEKDEHRYEILAVETKFSVPMIEDSFSMAGTLDLILRDLEDGTIVPVDHKSSYNFWTDDQAASSGQFIKYIYALRAQGHDVKRFMINQIRTRELKPGNEFFRRTWVRPSDTRIRAVVAQHVQVGAEIMEFRADPIKEAAIPIYDKYGCSNCAYFQLCDSDTEGANTSHLIASEYQKRVSYGYNMEAPE